MVLRHHTMKVALVMALSSALFVGGVVWPFSSGSASATPMKRTSIKTETWLTTRSGHRVLLGTGETSAVYQGGVCQAQKGETASLPSGDTVSEIFVIPDSSLGASGDFSGNATGLDDSFLFVKGLQFGTSAGNHDLIVLMTNETGAELPFSGWWEAIYTETDTGTC